MITANAIATVLNELSARLDEWAANGFDVEGPDFAEDRALIAGLRAGYRKLTGEII